MVIRNAINTVFVPLHSNAHSHTLTQSHTGRYTAFIFYYYGKCFLSAENTFAQALPLSPSIWNRVVARRSHSIVPWPTIWPNTEHRSVGSPYTIIRQFIVHTCQPNSVVSHFNQNLLNWRIIASYLCVGVGTLPADTQRTVSISKAYFINPSRTSWAFTFRYKFCFPIHFPRTHTRAH